MSSRPSHWQDVANQYFPGEQLDFAADVYQRAAREAAGLCLEITVDLATGVSSRSVNPVFDLAAAAERAQKEALAAAAYSVGYQAQLGDAKANTYERLDELVAVIQENRAQEEVVA